MEITKGTAQQHRLAMANVISTLNNRQETVIYLLSGTPQGISLYIGVADEKDATNAGKMLKNAFEGNFLGSKLVDVYSDSTELSDCFSTSKHLGLVLGIPSFNEEESNLEGEDFQSIERLVNMLSDTTWQMVIVMESGSSHDVDLMLNRIYELSTQLSPNIKTSEQKSLNKTLNDSITEGVSQTETSGTNSSDTRGKSMSVTNSNGSSSTSGTTSSSSNSSTGTNKGSSKQEGTNEGHTTGENQSTAKGTSQTKTQGSSEAEGLTRTNETVYKQLEQIHTHLNDTQIARFRLGQSKGMFRTAIYLAADTPASFDRLANGVKSIFQGSQPSFSPLWVEKLNIEEFKQNGRLCLENLVQIRRIRAEKALKENISELISYSVFPQFDPQSVSAATWLNTSELALLAGLPTLELAGLKLRKSVDFALNTVDYSNDANLRLGKIVQNGRKLEKQVEIPLDALNKHIFVTGVTGSGKTTTCMKVLLESKLPFTVIEPAKTEYRALHGQVSDIQYYALGREDLCTFRLNPFELMPSQNLSGHISMLKATMIAVFPMEASMPFIVEQAIIKAYEKRGWDIASSENYLVDDPWHTEESVFPTFSDMIAELDGVIKSAKMGREFEEKYRGSLVSRLTSLTDGIKGIMINTPRSINFDKLLDQKVVIELEELKDEEDKAFFMGLIIGRLAECMKQRHKKAPQFKHITLIEEAHRLLSKPEPGADGASKLGVEMFANLLAEVRKYGESLIIADQIPNKLVSDVIKNTNTKIVHRLFAADDRNAIGDAMSLDDEQKDFLPLLQAGETILYSSGWHASVRAQIDQLTNTTAAEIDEALIAQQGQLQLWQNRTLLFPNATPLVESLSANQPEKFVSLIKMARKQINMFISALKAQGKDKGKALSDVLHNRLSRLVSRLKQDCETFGISQAQLAELHLLVLLDTRTRINTSPKAYLDDWREIYPNILTALFSSLDDFVQLSASFQHSGYLYGNIDSLDQRNPI